MPSGFVSERQNRQFELMLIRSRPRGLGVLEASAVRSSNKLRRRSLAALEITFGSDIVVSYNYPLTGAFRPNYAP